MDILEFNKFAAAVLSALLLAFGSGALIEIILTGQRIGKPGYNLPVAVPEAEHRGAPAPAAEFNFAKVADLLKKANAENGQAVFKKCATCHTANEGGKNGTGPNLWNIVGRKIGSKEDFNYSSAVKNKGGEWTYENLAKYLHDPKAFIPGNRMAFAGVKDDTELADLLAYLRTLSPNPAPLPAD
jgi:cytochrome c